MRSRIAWVGIALALGVAVVTGGAGVAVSAGSPGAGSSASPSAPSPLGTRHIPTGPAGAPLAATTGPTAGGGMVERVAIPGVRSHFPARDAYVYLPPAARHASTARFPVVIALSGQSRRAGPADVIVQGHLPRIMDAIAAQHGGRAPIVVVPDQLGPGSPNPMCVDSALGRAATYITVDVRAWVLRSLPADRDRRDWTIAGFSEGGTCAIQFGAGFPGLFGSIVDVSGEVAPRNGTVAHTIAVGFGGSRTAYERAAPFALLRRSAPFSATRALFAAGALDTRYGRVAPVMARHARAAGMRVDLRIVPHARHNWRVATTAMEWAMNRLVGWWRLDSGSAQSG